MKPITTLPPARTVRQALLATSLTFGLAATAAAQWTLVENFESHANNANVNSANGWLSSAASPLGAVISGDPAGGLNKVLHRVGVGGASKALNIPNGTIATFFLRVRRGAAANDDVFGLSDEPNPDLGVALFGVFEAQSGVNAGNLRMRDGAANLNTPILQDVWYNMWMVVNTTTDSWKLYLQSSADTTYTTQLEIAANSPPPDAQFRNPAAANALVAFLTKAAGTPTTSVYFDDLYLDTSGVNLINPIAGDIDGDGLPDTWEVANSLNKNDNGTIGETSPGAKDGPNGALGDPDGDGLKNLQEFQNNSLAQNPDTDGDGLGDGVEVAGTSNAFSNGQATRPDKADTDDDGATDFQENGSLNIRFGNAPTNPKVADTDGDGMSDGYELTCNKPGTALNPNDNGSIDSSQAPGDDRDGDSLGNLTEFTSVPRTRADLADTDADGLDDNVEDKSTFWTGISSTGTNPANPDTDGDGLLDGQENYDLSVSRGGPGFPGLGVKPTNSDPNRRDTDGDQFDDYYEMSHGYDPDALGTVPPQSSGFTLVENFEGPGMITGSTFDGINGWHAPNPASATVVLEPVQGGEKVGRYVYPPLSVHNPLYKSLNTLGLQILGNSTGTLFFQVYAPTTDLNHSFGFSDVLTPATVSDFGNYEAQFTLVGPASELRVRDAAVFRSVGIHRVAQWMNVWIVANNGTDTLKVYVQAPDGQNGQVEITNDGGVDPFNFRNGTTDALGTLLLLDNSAENVAVLMDNFYVDPTSANLAVPAGVTKPGMGDGDRMDDAWEITYFGSTAPGEQDDFDHDGTSNYAEYRLGLIPNSGSSFFHATRSAEFGNLEWPSGETTRFSIERSTTLAAGSWTVVAPDVPADAGTFTSWTDPSPPGGPKVFYRVNLKP